MVSFHTGICSQFFIVFPPCSIKHSNVKTSLQSKPVMTHTAWHHSIKIIHMASSKILLVLFIANMCCFKWSVWVADKFLILHPYGISPVCFNVCCFRLPGKVMVFLSITFIMYCIILYICNTRQHLAKNIIYI